MHSINRKDQTPIKYFVACINHFAEKFIKHKKNHSKLHPVSNIHPQANSKPSVFRIPTVLRRSTKKILESDGLEAFTNRSSFYKFLGEHAPYCYTFERSEWNDALFVCECIMGTNLHIYYLIIVILFHYLSGCFMEIIALVRGKLNCLLVTNYFLLVTSFTFLVTSLQTSQKGNLW